MLATVEKLRLSGLYQLLALPATSATTERAERRPPNSSRDRQHSNLQAGDNGSASLYPFWGICKRMTRSFCNLSSHCGPITAGGGLCGLSGRSGTGHVGRPDWQAWPPAAAWWIVALLAGVAFLAERQCVAIGANTEMSISVLPILFAAVVFGPVAAMIVSACSLVGEFGRPYTRWIVWTSSRALIGAFAGLCALGLADRADSFGGVLLAVAIAAAVQTVGDILLERTNCGHPTKWIGV